MKPIEQDILSLKQHHAQMWELVETQVKRAYLALEKNDKDMAMEVISRERMVNAQELVVDHHCENFIALFNPVAIDLRFVISILKINNNLERIGDFAESIAIFVSNNQVKPVDPKLLKELHVKEMIDMTTRMLEVARTALMKEDSAMATKVLSMDEMVDTYCNASVPVLGKYIGEHPDTAEEMLRLNAVLRRIERIGDRFKNIAEDIVFYIDAKELRHKMIK